ncbi:hypothetical protein [Rheinheimera hassiensis]|uniref:hypothetical protein n=1 Tax=Rheinheimera hassiensis TaxID=1193627 RepID=UPI001F0631D6|nr:hypothetical protein [Rheinheimera hassiensis]
MTVGLSSYAHWPALFHADGTAQSEQRYAPLQSDYFQPDTLNFNQLLSLAAGLAENIRFVDLDGSTQGNWRQLFSRSEPAILAQIAALDANRLQQDLDILQQQTPLRQFNFVMTLLQQYHQWYHQLLQLGSESAVILADKLHSSWQTQLAPYLPLLQQATASLPGTADFTALLQFAPSSAAACSVDEALQRSVAGSLQLCRYLQQETAGQLNQLLRSQQNEPALALFLAFLRLYQGNQHQLNQLTERHLAFYYDDCLKMPWRKPIAQSIWLSLQPAATAVLLPANTRFSAGKTADGTPLLFHTTAPQYLQAVQVQQLYSLSLLSSKRISPEQELGFVSRIYSSGASIDASGGRALFVANDDIPRMPGFAIVSPTLQLSEGERCIELQLRLTPPQQLAARLTELLQRADYSWPQRLLQALAIILTALDYAILPSQLQQDATALASSLPDLPVMPVAARWQAFYQQVLMLLLLRTEQQPEFSSLFGMLFSYYLFGPDNWLSAKDSQAILAKAELLALENGNVQSYQCVQQLLSDDRMTVFYRYCSDLFLLSLSTATGFVSVAEYSIQPLGPATLGLQLRCQLSSSFAAICAFNDTDASMRLTLNPMAKLCGYSLCSQFDIAQCRLDVSVKNGRSLNLSNQLGPLDATKPFWPFGPVPLPGSYLLFNHSDWQHKHLQQLELELDWAELPVASEGLAGHYAAYGEDISNYSFKARLALLDQGRWQEVTEDYQHQAEFCLFAAAHSHAPVQPKQQLVFSAVSGFRLTAAQAAQPYHPAASQGFFRLSLSQPVSGFGHGRYSTALSETLLYNAKHKKTRPLPQPAYAPLLQLLSVSYSAYCDIHTSRDPASGNRDRLLQLYPFGQRQSYPSARRDAVRLLPHFAHQAYVFIGLTGASVNGQLSLLFDIEPASGSSNTVPENALRWQYLHDDEWLDFTDQALLTDSSRGLTSSGAVILQLPHALQQQHQLMPSGQAWLRLCCAGQSRRYGNLRRIMPNAVQLLATEPLPDAAMLSHSALQWALQSKQAGITVSGYLPVLQQTPREESSVARVQRIAERLSHKQRASTAWDFERLVLQAFPQLAKVKCFPNAALEQNSLIPGRLLLIVVAKPPGCQHLACQRSLVSGELLRQIKHYVAALASPFASIEVANPGFEQLQVRCAVQLNQALHSGDGLQRLQQALSDYLCPWHEQGLDARFGWQLRPQLVQSFIQQQPYVDYVTDFSLLHISQYGSRQYQLQDSASYQHTEQLVLQPARPWNLLTPARQHSLRVLAVPQPELAQRTGVSELEIGHTFIIQQEARDG